MSTVNGANVKIITIVGTSTRLAPQIQRQIQVILRDQETLPVVVPGPPGPVIDNFELDPQGSSNPVVAGQAIWGNVTFKYTTHQTAYANARLTIQIYVNSVLISSKGNAQESVGWYTPNTIDGPTQIKMVVTDDHGGVTTRNLTTGNPDVVLDNQPVNNNVTGSPTSIVNNNSGQITFQWNAIPDPANSGNTALQYHVIFYTYNSNKTLISTGPPQDIANSTRGQYPPTSATFSYSGSAKSYKVEIHAMCPVGCTGHQGQNAGQNNGQGEEVSTGFLSASGNL
jgi:hypothetical protein